MTEHRVKLRRGWECQEAGSPPSDARRLELPTRWRFDVPTRLILTRRFGRPALEPRQRVILQLVQIAGTRAIFLNGRPIEVEPAADSQSVIEIGDLAERNVLVLEIETPPPCASKGGTTDDWGVIALVIRGLEPRNESVVEQTAPGVAEEIHLE